MESDDRISEILVVGRSLTGDGTGTTSEGEVVLGELCKHNVVSIVAGGGSHCLALTDEGRVLALGNGSAGQLGLGEDIKKTTDGVELEDLKNTMIVSITTSFAQSAAINGSGQCFLWGSGHQSMWTPQLVQGIRSDVRISQVALGSAHVMALGWFGPGGSEESLLYVWGDNSKGQLGLGDWTSRPSPTVVEKLSQSAIKHISCGENHCVAVSEYSQVFFWGTLIPNVYFSTMPAVVEPLLDKNIQYTVCGASSIFAITESGLVYSWGVGRQGILGHGGEADVTLPTLIENLAVKGRMVRQIECGAVHCVALTEVSSGDGLQEVFVWGNPRHGKLGNHISASSPDVLAPVPLEMMRGKRIMQAACGSSFTMLLVMLDRVDEKNEVSPINLQEALGRRTRRKKKAGSWTSDDGEEADFRVRVHLFEEQHGSRPVWCMYCSKFMWGLRRVHFKCTGCGFLAHAKCKDLVHSECLGAEAFYESRGEPPATPVDKSQYLHEEEEVRRRWSKAQDDYTDDLRRSITHDSAPDIKKTLGLVSGTEEVESPQGEQRHPLAAKPHPFQAAAKVSVPSEVESEEKQKQIARIRAKIASHQKKIQRLEEELQRIMSGRQLVHSTSREDVLIGSETTMTATSSEGSMRKRTKIKLDKSWEIDPKQVMVEKVLGEGSSAQVFQGRYRGQEVAIKVFKNKVKRRQLQDFLCEYTIMREMKSKYNIFFYGASLNPNLCLIMELCHRGSVYDLLVAERQALRWHRALRILLEICRAVNCLHCWKPQIVHRDLKTRNLLLDQNWNLKIADFGLARLNTDTQRKGTLSKLRGTYTYCAPEIYFNEPFTDKSDVYSIGIMIWEMAVRVMRGKYERPYSEFPELIYDFQIVVQTSKGKRCTIPPQCPESVSKLIRACWAAEAEKRPTCAELIGEIQRLQREYRQNKEEWDALAAHHYELDSSGKRCSSEDVPQSSQDWEFVEEAVPAPAPAATSLSTGHDGAGADDFADEAAATPLGAVSLPPAHAAPTPEEYYGSGQ